jgi:hypothetical protein
MTSQAFRLKDWLDRAIECGGASAAARRHEKESDGSTGSPMHKDCLILYRKSYFGTETVIFRKDNPPV